jgi:hypothetical protein
VSLFAAVTVGRPVALAIMGAEVAMLVSLLVVAALVESGYSSEREAPTVAILREKFWVRRIANLLIGTALLCVVAAAIALACACVGSCGLAVATVISFAFALGAFSLACVMVLKALRDRIG